MKILAHFSFSISIHSQRVVTKRSGFLQRLFHPKHSRYTAQIVLYNRILQGGGKYFLKIAGVPLANVVLKTSTLSYVASVIFSQSTFSPCNCFVINLAAFTPDSVAKVTRRKPDPKIQRYSR